MFSADPGRVDLRGCQLGTAYGHVKSKSHWTPLDAFGIPGFNLDTPCMHRECLGTIRHPLDHPHMERLGMFLDV